ncbi:MAG: hypothetical protein II921_03515 [Treponema sp.]|nr:hypothetical protein [Treponema sp.]
MKKKICALFFVFMMLSASVYCQYYAEGRAEAVYKGTTADRTLDELYDETLQIARSTGCRLSTVSKLSKRANRLLWKALDQYDYAAGELYCVLIYEGAGAVALLNLCVCITADGGCDWEGFYAVP